MSGWSKLVALCTRVMGGYYRSNGTIVRNVAAGNSDPDGDSIFVETDVEFASIAERTHVRVRHQETQRQKNIEAILSAVSSHLGDKISIQNVDPDWSNVFFRYAQDISNKSTQSLWARALVNELKHPGSISKRSLSFLYNCDVWEITAFKKVANYAFVGQNGHPFIFRAAQDSKGKDDIFAEGRLLAHCQNAGMIADEPQDLRVGFKFEYDKSMHTIDHDFKEVGQPVGFYVQPFTKTGSDLLKFMGGLESIPSSNLQRRIVWDYLADFIEIESKPMSEKSNSTSNQEKSKDHIEVLVSG